MTQLSIIVPIYKVEPYLRCCIDSILAQTFTDFELILVDDGSPDNCGKICDEYARKDSRIRVIHKENAGLSDARNTGIEAAAGGWLMFIDGDDYIACDMVEKLYRAVTERGAQMAVCGVTFFDEASSCITPESWRRLQDGDCKGRDILETVTQEHPYIDSVYVIACNKLFAASLWKEMRYPVGKIHEDEFMAHRCYGKCDKVVILSEPLYFYRQNPNGIIKRPYSVSRLDYFDALADRIRYYKEIELTDCIDAMLYHFYDQLREKYFRLVDDRQNHNRMVECRKSARELYFDFFKSKTVSYTVKIATLCFLYCPPFYGIIWHRKR